MGFAAGRAPKNKNVTFDFIRFLLPIMHIKKQDVKP
jgi:hypothetical protein